MNIDQAFPSKYLKASDLPEETLVPVTIEDIQMEEIGQGDDKQIKPVITFVGKEKAFVCNKTNANTIAKVLGSRDTDEWIGKRIRLYRTEVQFGADMVESIRVSSKIESAKPATKPAPAKPQPQESEAAPNTDDIPW